MNQVDDVRRNQHTSVASRAQSAVAIGAGVALFAVLTPTALADSDPDSTSVTHSRFEIITNALGLEHWTEYPAREDALGRAWADHFGVEASYYGLGDSKFKERRGGSSSENIGGRADLKLAMDVFTAVNDRARLYSRVGMYWWDVDINYNQLSNDLDSSNAGTSRLVGLGAVYGIDPLRFGIEWEQLDATQQDTARDEQRVLFSVYSKY